jgi:hypothetical protein
VLERVELPEGWKQASTLKEAEDFAKRHGAPILPKTAKDAARMKVDALIEEFAEVAEDPIKQEELYQNWLRIFRKKDRLDGKTAFYGLDAGEMLKLQNAINMNHANLKYKSMIESLGARERVVFERAKPNLRHAGENIGGVAHMYQSKYGFALNDEIPLPGKGGTNLWGGEASALRHEMGHRIYTQLQRQQPEFYREWLTKVHAVEGLDKKLTWYSTQKIESVGDEAFCEVFATVTSSKYDPTKFGKEVQDLGDYVLEKAKGLKFQPR